MSANTLTLPATENYLPTQGPVAPETLSNVSHTFEYLNPTAPELNYALNIVAQAEQVDVVQACRNLLERNGATDIIEHGQRVALATAIIGKRAGLNDDEILLAAQAAECHDVGKVTPEIREITESSEHFEGVERKRLMAVVKRHAQLGADIVRTYVGDHPDGAALVEIVGGHHVDSIDDPYGPFPYFNAKLTRIVALADELDGLASPRSYKPAMSKAETRQILYQQFNANAGLIDLCFN